jgi:hypothetical protein
VSGPAAPPRGFDPLIYDAAGVDLETVLTRVCDATAAQWDWIDARLRQRFGHDAQQLAEMRGYFFGEPPAPGDAPHST